MQEKIMPLVSVIIPNYNYAQYLGKRIDTVLNQTYQNIELIILDDCSKDDSREIIESYRNHQKVREIIYNDHNSGSVFKQWEKGIELASGEIVWIAEADDYCELTFLEELLSEWYKYEHVAMAFCNFVQFDDEAGYWNVPKEHKSRCFDGLEFIRKRQVRQNVPVNASGCIFSKDAYMHMPHDYTRFRSAGDYMFWTAIMTQGNVVRVRKNLSYFRIHVGSVTNRNVSQGITCLEDAQVYQFIDKNVGLSWYDKYMADITHYDKYMSIRFDDEGIRKEVLTQWGIYGIKRNKPLSNILSWLPIRFENYLGILI